MKKLLNKPWFAALLAIAAVVLIAQTLLDQRQPRSAAFFDESATTFAEDADTSDRVETSSTLAEALKAVVVPDQIADPFAVRIDRTAVDAEETSEAKPDHVETVHLTALWEQGGAAYLILNGRIYSPGEVIGRITVESVERTGVWLSHWKGRDFLTIGNTFTLVTPASPAANQRTAHHEG